MPKSLYRSFVSKAGLCVLSTFVGLGAGLLLCCSEDFEFNPSIALGQVLHTCALLIMFILAHHVYAKAHDSRKKKTEILIGMVGDILTQVEQAHVAFLKCAAVQRSLSTHLRHVLDSALRDYSNAVKEFEEALKHSEQLPGAPDLEELKHDREAYKDLVTESPYPGSVPEQRITNESKLHHKIRSNLRHFQLQLSDY